MTKHNFLRTSERGATLLVALHGILVISALSAALLMVAEREQVEQSSSVQRLRAFYVAEAGLHHALDRVRTGLSASLGSATNGISFDGGVYWTESEDLGGGHFRLTAHSRFQAVPMALEAHIGPTPGSSAYAQAVFGDVSTVLGGSAFVDSYSSSAGPYAGQASNTAGGVPYAGTQGTVGSNGPISVLGLATVFGDVAPGPVNTAVVAGTSLVMGSTLPAPMMEVMTIVESPAAVAVLPSSLLSLTGIMTNLIPPGGKRLNSVLIRDFATLTIQGPATVVMDDLVIRDGGQLLVDATLGPVFLYIKGRLEVLGTAGVRSSRKNPADLMMFVETDNYTGFEAVPNGDPARPVQVLGGETHGVLYAPNASVKVGGTGEIFGAVFGKTIRLEETGRVHYDIDLLGNGKLAEGDGDLATAPIEEEQGSAGGGGGASAGGPSILSWRTITHQ